MSTQRPTAPPGGHDGPAERDIRSLPLLSGAGRGRTTSTVRPGALDGAAPTQVPPTPRTPPVAHRDRTPATQVPSAPLPTTTPTAGVDWDHVRRIRELTSERLSSQISARGGSVPEDTRRELGRSLIRDLLREHAEAQASEGGLVPSPEQDLATAKAVFDGVFGLGRLQPLVDDVTIEDVEIVGHDHVLTLHADGRRVKHPPIADNDEALTADVQFLASQYDNPGFTPAQPWLEQALPGRVRVQGFVNVSQVPVLKLRIDRLKNITLEQLVEAGMLELTLANFLGAAIVARKSVVICGDMGAGKTTLLRALAAKIPAEESLITLESQYELYLDQLPGRERRPVTLAERPGSGEVGPNGRSAGQITLDDLFPKTLRSNSERLVVGELREDELLALIKGAQAGAGVMTTLHARSAADAVERLATLLMLKGIGHLPAYRMVNGNIDLVVHIGTRRDRTTGRRHRFVREVIEPSYGDVTVLQGAPTALFVPGPDGRAVPEDAPSFVEDLEDVGWDPTAFERRLSTWPELPAGLRRAREL
ncbi:CpaF/VirB11 family protein [uncultured Pseudokineococcus sp.]|uniref:CpaF/VirB11 family protein n=1 Tax=uncultured Pseudokineococcus sp. TaxID=1642928 RepID=UPI002603C256|nr:CpaF/VirB11 family protein [uncultured Pseudokineococcus sp.]